MSGTGKGKGKGKGKGRTAIPTAPTTKKKKQVPMTTILRNQIAALEQQWKDLEDEERDLRQNLAENIEEHEKIVAAQNKDLEKREEYLTQLKYTTSSASRDAELAERELKTLALEQRKMAMAITMRAQSFLDVGDTAVAPDPNGITLVFTSVEGADEIVERVPDEAQRALDMYTFILRTGIRQFGGYEVKIEGDQFMVAFADPVDAVAWCLEVQSDTLNADWTEALLAQPEARVQRSRGSEGPRLFAGLRVRMGVHTGNARLEVDPNTKRADYFGPMVNRTARICGATHGGQVLVSGTTMRLIESELETTLESPHIENLGAHRLKDLATDETLFSMQPLHLAAREFPIPMSARPPTALIEQHMNILLNVADTFIQDFARHDSSRRNKLAEAENRVVDIQEAQDWLRSYFSVERRNDLMERVSSLVHTDMPIYQDSMQGLAKVTAAGPAVIRAFDAMDVVLANVDRQLNVLPVLEKEIARIKQEILDLRESVQREREGFLDGTAVTEEALAVFAKRYETMNDTLGRLLDWSNKDQLNLDPR